MFKAIMLLGAITCLAGSFLLVYLIEMPQLSSWFFGWIGGVSAFLFANEYLNYDRW